MKAAHLKTGEQGEEQATHFLEAQGYLVLERNWRFGRSEVDIICGKGEELVFVEVKTRTSSKNGNPESFVGPAKRKKMTQAATAFLLAIKGSYSLRFDIIAITPNEILHFENVFQPETEVWGVIG